MHKTIWKSCLSHSQEFMQQDNETGFPLPDLLTTFLCSVTHHSDSLTPFCVKFKTWSKTNHPICHLVIKIDQWSSLNLTSKRVPVVSLPTLASLPLLLIIVSSFGRPFLSRFRFFDTLLQFSFLFCFVGPIECTLSSFEFMGLRFFGTPMFVICVGDLSF